MPVKITWSNNTSDAAYVNEIWRKVVGSDDPYEYLDQVAITETEFTDTTAVDETTYTYRVAVFNSTNGNRTWSDEYEEYTSAERARTLLAGETDGLAIAFVDDTAMVKDSGGSDVFYNSILDMGLDPRSSTPEKIIRGKNGLLGWQKNNTIRETDNVSDASGNWAVVGSNQVGSDLSLEAGCVIDVTARYDRFSSSWNEPGMTVIMEAKCEIYSDVAQDIQFACGSNVQAFTHPGGGWIEYTNRNSAASNSITVYVRNNDASGAAGKKLGIRYLRNYVVPCANTDFISNASTNSPTWGLPIDHDINGNSLGVLNEPQANNIQFPSNDFSTNWVISGVATHGQVDPFGGNDATLITANATTAGVRTNTTLATTEKAVAGLIVKKSSGSDWLRLQLNSPGAQAVWVNMTTGAVGTISVTENTQTTAHDLGNGWWFFGFDCAATANSTFYIRLADGDGSNNANIGDEIIVAHGHVSDVTAANGVTSSLTSPIITAGSQVTRVADAMEYNLSGLGFYPPSAGTYYAVMTNNEQLPDNAPMVFIGTATDPFSSGGSSNPGRWRWRITGGGGFFGAGRQDDQNEHKAAWSFDTAQTRDQGSLDGVTGDTGNASAHATGTTLFFCGNTTLNHSFYIKEYMSLPREMTQTELNTLTTP